MTKGKYIRTIEIRKKCSLSRKIALAKGVIVWNKGIPRTPEEKLKISIGSIGKKHSEKTKFKMHLNNVGKNNPMYGVHRFGKDNPNYKGGIAYLPYGAEFNNILKERIRDRDGRKCQLCGCPEIECLTRLIIHHIDYDKKNNNEVNLISLCGKCHSKTNGNRKFWYNFFRFRDN